MYHVVLTKRAIKGLDRAPDHIRKKATEAIQALQESFAPAKLFDVKKLKGMEILSGSDWAIGD
ncbi:MAG: hypothetical protein PXY39_04490 [archaeon]|nr:hypothetical protein [archaeon]